MYHIAICDDEPIFLRQTSRMLGEVMMKHQIPYTLETFQSAKELGAYIRKQPNALDLILLDILLDHENGIDFADTLRSSGSRVSIIFVTVSTDFLLDAYSVEPIGYILKPISIEKLEKAVLRAYHKTLSTIITIQTPNTVATFRSEEILYIEVNNKLLSVYLSDGKTQFLHAPLGALSGKLPENQFFQCHRSYIVSLNAIRSISKYEISLKDGRFIPVSRSRYRDLQRTLINQIANS